MIRNPGETPKVPPQAAVTGTNASRRDNVSHKINGIESRQVQIGSDRPVQRKSSESATDATTKVQVGAEAVHITGSAKQLASLEQTLKDLPVIDEARVANLRSAIESGTYVVDATRVAEKLLMLEGQLGSALPE